jgi:hypothetical protein
VTARGALPLGLVVVLAAFPLLQLATGGFNYWLHMGMVGLMYVAMASSWNIIGGYAGYISLGHSAFYGIGGYVTGALMTFYGISPFISAPLAGLVCFGLGLPVGLITLRTRGPAFIISTTPGGFFEVQNDTVLVLADQAEPATSIDLEAASQSLREAEQKLSSLGAGDPALPAEQERVRRARARVEAARAARS